MMWAAAGASGLLDLGATIFGVAGIAGLAWAVFRTKGTGATIDLLEQSVRIERVERLALEERCKRELAEANSKIDVLTEAFAAAIAQAVTDHLADD